MLRPFIVEQFSTASITIDITYNFRFNGNSLQLILESDCTTLWQDSLVLKRHLASARSAQRMKFPCNHVPGVGVVKATAYGGIGQKLLERMGWNEGEGLGKDRDGIKQSIKLPTQRHTRGLGHLPEPEWKLHDWTHMYESQLSKVDFSRSDDSSSEEEAAKDVAEENPDGTKTTALVKELEIYSRLENKKKLGGWSSRRGKLARLQRQEMSNADLKKSKNKKLKKQQEKKKRRRNSTC